MDGLRDHLAVGPQVSRDGPVTRAQLVDVIGFLGDLVVAGRRLGVQDGHFEGNLTGGSNGVRPCAVERPDGSPRGKRSLEAG